MIIGVIGCGAISGAYFDGAKNVSWITIKACADINMAAAKVCAEKYGCLAVSVDELLADQEIELVLNLTIPKAHLQVGLSILNAGKHVYSEKPLGVDCQEGQQLLDAAAARSLRVGCAPDTFLGAGVQTSRSLIEEGVIGTPTAGTAFLAGPGHESWHPNPFFYYEKGGGPMMDMGPYYITALVNMLGAAKNVAAFAKRTYTEREATCEAVKGAKISVETDTHLTGVIEFESGALITMIMSFDVKAHTLPCIEIYGTNGSIKVPDPNFFSGEVKVSNSGEWEIKTRPFADNARFIGVVDMVGAIKKNRPHRASGQLAYHVLEIMEAFTRSAREGVHIPIQSKAHKPAPMPSGLGEWEVENHPG